MAKKTIALLLALSLMVTSAISFEAKGNTDLDLNAEAYVLIDPVTGRVLLEKNSNQKRPMASTTKIMTAIIALEKGELSSRVKVSNKAASVGGSSFRLKSGEELALEDMLYGLLLPSGNDAATAIAEHIGQNQEDFVYMMNKKAVELGALDTHFANPHGLDEPGHYTTCMDLAKIASHAWRIKEFRKIVQTRTKDIRDGNSMKHVSNTNRLLWELEGTDGIKTGYTGKAGRCLVATSNNNGFRLLSVVLGSNDHFRDSRALLNYGFNHYKPMYVTLDGKSYTNIQVDNGLLDNTSLIAKESIQLPLKDGEACQLKFVVPRKIEAPITRGQPVGQIHIYINDKFTCSTSLIASRDIRRKTLKDIYERLLLEWLQRSSDKKL